MIYVLGLATALTLLWWGMSFVSDPLVLSLGAISIFISVMAAMRLGLKDRETSPYHRIFGFLLYTPYLIGEIVKSNLTVIKAILSPDLDIEPTLVKVNSTCRSDLAKVIFANSITLTPGTVTLRVDDNVLLVHGLYEANAQPESFDEMDRRASIAGDGRSGKKGKGK
ncbi:MAG: cation:proton antiporter [Ponticaulis sp.]|nr:cation:proton antiporter [Ponticaulis sp.]